jgi:DNA polymerase I-like protein with 3'-5' exonuclease and polymerase domains
MYLEGQQPIFLPESNWIQPELPDLSSESECGIDVETRDDALAAGKGPGWHAGLGYVAGISVSWREHAIYINLQHPDSDSYPKQQVADWLKKLFSQTETRFVFFNASYDIGWLQADFGVAPPAQCVDSAAAAAMVDENLRSYSMEAICGWRGIEGKDENLLREAAAAYGYAGKNVKPNLWRLPARFVAPYAEEDARRPRQLLASLMPEIEAQGMTSAFQLECDLIPLIVEMRRRGLALDVDHAIRTAALFDQKRDEALAEIARQAGGQWTMTDVRSNQRLERTFNEAGIVFPRTAPSEAHENGLGSFQGDWMKGHEHWLPRRVAAARKYDDLANKFIRGYILGFAHRGRIHPTVNQFRAEGGGTRSHRVSYSDPPLQQMPSRDDETAPLVRSAFRPDEGCLWGALDYSQQEYRFMVHFAELLKLEKASEAADRYRTDPATDFHNLVVDMTGLPRRRAKDCNFAKSYGAGIAKFAEMTGMTEDEAARTMERYDQEMPFIGRANQEFQKLAARRGYIRLVDGARAHFDDWEPGYREFKAENAWVKRQAGRTMLSVMPCRYEEALRRTQDADHPWYGKVLRRADVRKAFNRGVQGSSARQTKMAMRECWRAGIMPRLQMHDELGFSLTSEADGQRAAQIMRDVVKLNVPMLVDAEYGVSWGRAAKDKKAGYGATWAEAWAEKEAGKCTAL